MSPATATAKANFTAVTSQLVSLSLEIEECHRASELLRKALDREQERAKTLAQDTGAPFKAELAASDARHKRELAEHLERAEKLLERKKGMSAEAKELLEKVRAEQAATTAAVGKVREEAGAELARAQATWSQGEDIRRDRWLARRTKEIREMTMKGLEPEIERIMEKHRASTAQLETQLHEEAQRLRQRICLQGEGLLAEEKGRCRQRAEEARKAALEDLAQRRQGLMQKHQENLDRLRQRAVSEAEAQRRWQQEELRRLDANAAADVTRVREEERARLQEDRRRHAEDMAAAGRRHGAALSGVSKQNALEREEWEKRAAVGGASHGDKEFRAHEEALRRDRDARIDEAIKRLQEEGMEADRLAREKAEAEMGRAGQAHEDEVRVLREKQAQWGQRQAQCADAIHSLMEDRHRLAVTARELSAQAAVAEGRAAVAQASRKEREAEAGYGEERALREHREREAEAGSGEERALREHRELLAEAQERRRGLREKIAAAERQLTEVEERSSERAAVRRLEHDRHLEALQAEVKSKIGEQDAELRRLHEEVHMGRLRSNHATKLLAKYAKRTTAVATAAEGAGAAAPVSSASEARNGEG